MPKKIVVELALLNKLTKPLDMASGKVKRLGVDTKRSFRSAALAVRGFIGSVGNAVKKIFNLRNAVAVVMVGFVAKKFMNAAMIRVDRTEKPVYYALKTMIGKIDYFTSVEKLDEGLFKFIVNGTVVYVLWDIGTLPDEIAGQIKVTEMLGIEKIVDADEIEITEKPIFLEIT